jgi:tellurite resistance protein
LIGPADEFVLKVPLFPPVRTDHSGDMTAPRIPLNFFGIPFGLAGLAGGWLTLADDGHVPVAVGNVLLALAALVWAVLVVAYVLHAASDRSRIGTDLLDPIASPFASLVFITPVLLGAEGVYPHAGSTGRVVVDVFVAAIVLLAAWFTGQWIYGPLDFTKLHPGYFLPTVAGGLVASIGAAEVGQPRLAEAMFGLGVVSWLVVGSMILARLFFQPPLPTPLVPTLAIEVAPAAVASLAYFAQHGDRIDQVAAFLAGYGVLMALAQLRLLPVFMKLPFMPSFWAFTFSWAAVASAGLHWLDALRPAGYVGLEYVVIAVITGFIGAIAGRTLVALVRGELLTPPTAQNVPPTPALPAPVPSTKDQPVRNAHV